MGGVRVAYTLEQCWHRSPGGTAVAALEIARAMAGCRAVTLVGVAGRHRHPPAPAYRSPIPIAQLPLPRPALYEAWLRVGRPLVESATGPVDVAHATVNVPCATRAPLVVTMHDLAFAHWPERFSWQGRRVMSRSLDVTRDTATFVIAPSRATADDLVAHGIDEGRVRVVHQGVHAERAADADVARVRAAYALPPEFVLFVGTLEPRKNLARLVDAVGRLGDADRLPLVVVGPEGWGGVAGGVREAGRGGADVRAVGFVPPEDLGPLYAAATVFAYPSEWEGFGLPVAEAMAQGTPVVTSRGTATEEVAAGAAELVDPLDVDSIAAGLVGARSRGAALAAAGLRRAAELTWDASAAATAAVYREAAAR